MASLATILEYNKPEKAQTNQVLLEIARKVVNSSPEPRYKIKLRDEILAMKEKERLGFNFNRSVTASLKSRWDVVEKATLDYLEEVADMNDQIEEDSRKYENQLVNLIVTRTTNLGLNSRIEQMAGLFMHMNFYCTVLKFKIQQLEPTRAFMFTCSDLLGFQRPSQLIDRYSALQHVFTELYADYEARQNLLNHLAETLSEVKAETNHRNMLMHNQMADMHARIKQLQTESAYLERAILDQMEMSTGASLEIYKIKNAVYNIFITMMNYRGLEASQMDSLGQLEELKVRISQTQAAVKMLQQDELKRQLKKKFRKQSSAAMDHTTPDEGMSDSSHSDSDSDEETKKPSMTDHNVSAATSLCLTGSLSSNQLKFQVPALRGNIYRNSLKSAPVKLNAFSLPPISEKEVMVSDEWEKSEEHPQCAGNWLPPLGAALDMREKMRSSAKAERACMSLTDGRSNLLRLTALRRSASVLNKTNSCGNTLEKSNTPVSVTNTGFRGQSLGDRDPAVVDRSKNLPPCSGHMVTQERGNAVSEVYQPDEIDNPVSRVGRPHHVTDVVSGVGQPQQMDKTVSEVCKMEKGVSGDGRVDTTVSSVCQGTDLDQSVKTRECMPESRPPPASSNQAARGKANPTPMKSTHTRPLAGESARALKGSYQTRLGHLGTVTSRRELRKNCLQFLANL